VFESRSRHALIAQSAEHPPCKREVPGSIPWCGLQFEFFGSAFVAQLVEQPLGMWQAACSIHAEGTIFAFTRQ
jgi:hypothetical protein